MAYSTTDEMGHQRRETLDAHGRAKLHEEYQAGSWYGTSYSFDQRRGQDNLREARPKARDNGEYRQLAPFGGWFVQINEGP